MKNRGLESGENLSMATSVTYTLATQAYQKLLSNSKKNKNKKKEKIKTKKP